MLENNDMSINSIMVHISSVYTVLAVQRAIYDFRANASVEIRSSDRTGTNVEINIKNKKNEFDLENEIKQLVLEHQIRIDIEKEYKSIREIILAQAFFPCENIKEISKLIDK